MKFRGSQIVRGAKYREKLADQRPPDERRSILIEHRRAGRTLVRHGLDHTCDQCEVVNRQAPQNPERI
jgi:hypothetical protein